MPHTTTNPIRAQRTPKRLNQNPLAVRQTRQARGMSLRDLSIRVGAAYSLLSEIETGTRSAKPELLAKIADELDVPLSMLSANHPQCPLCEQPYSPAPDGMVPMHTLPNGDWCLASRTMPGVAA